MDDEIRLLREFLRYDPETGHLWWLKNPYLGSNSAGVWARQKDVRAGRIKHGYIVVHFRGKTYPAHRLAYLLVEGKWPAAMIDHKNRVRSDNRYCNLRAATPLENVRNQGRHKNNASGHRGVSFHKKSGKWQAQVRVCGKLLYLGLFDTAELAGDAAARRRFASFDEFGENF